MLDSASRKNLIITLSNYFDVAPGIVNGITIPETSEVTTSTREARNFIV